MIAAFFYIRATVWACAVAGILSVSTVSECNIFVIFAAFVAILRHLLKCLFDFHLFLSSSRTYVLQSIYMR